MGQLDKTKSVWEVNLTSTSSDQTKTLYTAGTFLNKNIQVKVNKMASATTGTSNTGTNVASITPSASTQYINITEGYTPARKWTINAVTATIAGNILGTTKITKNSDSISGTTYTPGSLSLEAGKVTQSDSISGVSFANTATSGITYRDISDTTAAPVLVSDDYLYINEGYTKPVKISLAKLIPDVYGTNEIKATSAQVLSGCYAWDKDGKPVAGSIATAAPSPTYFSESTTGAISESKLTGGQYLGINYYIKAGTLASTGGAVSAVDSNVVVLSTTNNGIAVKGQGSGKVSTAGWIDVSTATSASSQTKYIQKIVIPSGKSFTIDLTNNGTSTAATELIINDGITTWHWKRDASGNTWIEG